MQKSSLQVLHESNIAIRKRRKGYLSSFPAGLIDISLLMNTILKFKFFSSKTRDGLLLKYMINFMVVTSVNEYCYKTIILPVTYASSI